jgi:hypothetical protein
MYIGLRLLHILCMTAWFGSMLFVTGDVKRTIAAGPAHLPLLRDRVGRVNRVAGIAGALTVLSGFALIFAVGGFKAVPPAIHTGMLLGLIAWAIGALGFGRTWTALSVRLDAGADAASVADLVKRLGMFTGLFHATWLAALLTMVLRNGL